MKKMVISTICVIFIMLLPVCYANNIVLSSNSTNQNNTNVQTNNEAQGTEQIVEIKKKSEKKLEEYKKEYGSDAYGIAAYVLNVVRIYSIPFCFIGIAVGAIYQYVIGIHKLDERDKGFTMIISFVTILVIAQILPLIFAIVVKGWRG